MGKCIVQTSNYEKQMGTAGVAPQAFSIRPSPVGRVEIKGIKIDQRLQSGAIAPRPLPLSPRIPEDFGPIWWPKSIPKSMKFPVPSSTVPFLEKVVPRRPKSSPNPPKCLPKWSQNGSPNQFFLKRSKPWFWTTLPWFCLIFPFSEIPKSMKNR